MNALSVQKLMKLVFVLLFISSFSLILVLFGDYEGELINKICAYLVGICFWGGLIAGYILFGVINSKRKKKKESAKKRPGVICFFSNKYAKVFDILFVISLILSVVFMFIPALNQGIVLVLFISVCVFSLHMHSILNGVNYEYIQNQKEE